MLVAEVWYKKQQNLMGTGTPLIHLENKATLTKPHAPPGTDANKSNKHKKPILSKSVN